MNPVKPDPVAERLTCDILFQSRDQDGDLSKHPWAKPGSVKVFCVCVCSFKRVSMIQSTLEICRCHVARAPVNSEKL